MGTLVFRYAIFAAIATAANLLVQRLVIAGESGSLRFTLAMLAGTAAGLVVKYVLDKRWIFYDEETGLASHSRKFGLYSAMGVITTLIFWGTETFFWMTWGTERAREVGAIIGLGVGYVIKYYLDRRYVFTPRKVEV